MKYNVQRISDEKGKEELLRLWNQNHDTSLDGKYEWMYDGNPAGKAAAFLVSGDETHECIGCSSVFPRKISVQGVGLHAGVAGDLFVQKENRVLLPAMKLVKNLVSIVKNNEFDLIYLQPNQNAAPVMKRAGFRRLGPWMGAAKIIRTSKKLERMHVNKYVNRLVSPLLDVALKLISLETWYRAGRGFTCEEVPEFDKRFGGLWQKARSRFLVVGERSPENLTWKFGQKPGAEYRIFAIFGARGTEAEGYVVYSKDEDSIAVNDFVLPDDRTAGRIFMAHFLRHVRKSSPTAIRVRYLGSEEHLSLFKRFGFVGRESDWDIYYYCNAEVLKRHPALEEHGNWLLTNFDIDN